jgi:hypothetical protein|tara:strand:+ start:1061 stop:1474 length:414 start_codon:yes stop_codon:yes gene_type:complete
MGNSLTINKINFEDVQEAIRKDYVIVNTLTINKQNCLIDKTLSATDEVSVVNRAITSGKLGDKIILYGENSTDNSVYSKYKQLSDLGFDNISVYLGGLFEWLLLQDIYGADLFPTSKREPNHLQYKGAKKIDVKMIE